MDKRKADLTQECVSRQFALLDELQHTATINHLVGSLCGDSLVFLTESEWMDDDGFASDTAGNAVNAKTPRAQRSA